MFQKVANQKELNNETILWIEDEAKLVSPVNIKNAMDNGYFITCDSMIKKYPGYKAFNLQGKSYEDNIWQSEDTDFPHWIKWMNPTGFVVINRYSIQMPLYFGEGYSQENIETNIRSWTFEGSKDNVKWEVLDKVNLEKNIGNGNFIIRKLENKVSFVYFRFVFTRNFSIDRKDISIGMIKCWSFKES